MFFKAFRKPKSLDAVATSDTLAKPTPSVPIPAELEYLEDIVVYNELTIGSNFTSASNTK